MNFLGIGPMELLFIVVIIMVIIGPRDAAKTARSIGRFLNRLYRSETWRSLTQASRSLRSLPNRLAREAAMEELDDVEESLGDIRRDLSQELRGLEVGPEAPAEPGDRPDTEVVKSPTPPPAEDAPRAPED
jgi:Sec-independent protein translocase protein TatA